MLAIHCALPPKSQSETPSRSGGRVAYVQRSVPGLKNARRGLTIKPPRLPTTKTAKPILVQRKPPADPGPAPFKKKKERLLGVFCFSKCNFFLKFKNKERTKWASCRRGQLAAPGSVARRLGRRLLFTRARPAPRSLWRSSQGRSRGARALAAVRLARERGGGARSRPVRAPPEGGAGSARRRGAVWGACGWEELVGG